MTQRHSLPDKVNLYNVILADGTLSATSKVIAGWLLFHHHNTETGVCTPSNRTVGKAVGVRHENVSRHVRMLVNAGYLIVRRRFGTSNSYDFDWSKGGKEAVSAIRRRLKGMNGEARGMTETTRPTDENVKTPCSNRQDPVDENVNLILEKKTGIKDGNLKLSGEIGDPLPLNGDEVISPSFEPGIQNGDDRDVASFRSIYPLVISKEEVPAVRKALRRALTVANMDAILNGAVSYATECVGREARFIADPVNWLNGGRWTSKSKTKSDLVILDADGKPLQVNQTRPSSRRQEILEWTPSRKNPFSLQ
jgi:hypothetical protein